MKTRKYITTMVVLLLIPLVAACRNPLGSSGSNGGIDESGVLRLTFAQSDTLAPLTLIPDTEITHFQVSGSTASGASFSRTVDAAETTIEQTGLLAGLWTVRVDAYNAGSEIILTGSTAVMIVNGEVATAQVVLRDPEGNGTLSFRLEWPAGLLMAAEAQASLQPADEALPPQILDFVIDHDEGVAQYEGEWPAGFHTLIVSLLQDGQTVWGDSYAVQLIAGASTTEAIALELDDLDLPPGTSLWTFSAGEGLFSSIWSSPAIAPDGTIYVGSDDNRLYAINSDGTKAWEYETGGQVDSTPAVGADGLIYFGSHDYNVYAVNPDGTLAWSYATGGWVRSSPAIGTDGAVYIGSNDGLLYSLNSDGSLRWSFDTGNNVVSSPAVMTSNGIDVAVIFGSQNGTVYAVDPAADGQELWSFPTSDWVYSSPAVGSGGTVFVGSYDGSLYALDSDWDTPPGEREIWTYDAADWIGSSPAVGTDGTVYVGSRNGLVHAVDSATGATVWTFPAGQGGVYSSPIIGDDGTVYVGSYDRHVYAINPDGSEQWRFETGIGGVYSSPVIGSDGTVYVGGRDGNLYAFSSSSSGPAQSPWPMFGRDLRRSGRSQ